MPERLGLTMRFLSPSGGRSAQNVLSDRWTLLLKDSLPGVKWVPIPNLGSGVIRYLADLEIGAVILTGGNDVGQCHRRDETERAILAHCSESDLPVLGVCRGLQLMQSFYGGRLTPVSEEKHVRTFHHLNVSHPFGKALGATSVLVNSFHRFGVKVENLSPKLEPWLISEDDVVEALIHKERRQIAVQWHPERVLPDSRIAHRLLRYFWYG